MTRTIRLTPEHFASAFAWEYFILELGIPPKSTDLLEVHLQIADIELFPKI